VALLLGTVGLGQGISGPDQMDQCDEATFTIEITNTSSTEDACRIAITNTPPATGFLYVPLSAVVTLPDLTEYPFDPTDPSWDIDTIVGAPFALLPGETLTVTFGLRTTCTAVSGNDQVVVEYENCAQPDVPFGTADSLSIEVLPGAFLIEKTPSRYPAAFEEEVTWTVTVRSTGLGAIRNVVVTDILGPGLAYVSSDPEGVRVGQEITWDSGSVGALALIEAGDSVSFDLTTQVIACEGLENQADARWGCDGGPTCDDTAVPGGCGSLTATAAVEFIVRLPELSFTPPLISIPYCTATERIEIPIENTGDGTAHEGRLCVDLGALGIEDISAGAIYANGCFLLPDIPAGDTYELSFDVRSPGNWCTGGPSGALLYTLDYENDCGVLHLARPQYGSVSSSGTPGLSVTKTGPQPPILGVGASASYPITVTYTGPFECLGTTGEVTVVDEVPDGFVVSDADGGFWSPGPNTIEWRYTPTEPARTRTYSPRFQVANDCGICGQVQINTVTASVTDCCGCVRTSSASASTAITCELLLTSDLTIDPPLLERCGEKVTFTDVHTFLDDDRLDDVSFDEFVYFAHGDHGMAYVPGSIHVYIDLVETVVASVEDTTPGGTVHFHLADTRKVRGHTLTYVFRMSATEDPPNACSGATAFAWVGHELGDDGPVGACDLFYDTTQITLAAPAMGVSIGGIPTIQEDCATYDVTVTLNRASPNAAPRDVSLRVSGLGSLLVDLGSALCTGVPSTDGTSCESPIADPIAGTLTWRFADGFVAGDQATITFPVTVPCGAALINLSATAFFDDLCADDATDASGNGYDETCSASGSTRALLRMTGSIFLQDTPEVIYATSRLVTWQITVANTGNGTAYNVYVDDELFPGLIYRSWSATPSAGVSSTPNQDHLGAAMNGATWLIESIPPGGRVRISFTAELVSCTDLRSDVTAGWGCGTDCQQALPRSSRVVVPTSYVIATSSATTPVDTCATQALTVTLRNAGIASVYAVQGKVTLPSGLTYAGSTTYQVAGGPPQTPVGEPQEAPGPGGTTVLTWTEVEIPALAEVAPLTTVWIVFDAWVSCSFAGGSLRFQAAYENPCRFPFSSNTGSFTLSNVNTPSITVQVVQVSPLVGEAIACGDAATWEITVANAPGAATADVVRVEDTLGEGLTLTYPFSTGDPTYGPSDGGTRAGQIVTWEVQDLPPGATAVLSVTAVSVLGDDPSCTEITNSVTARWGCGPVDGLSATDDAACYGAAQATASATGLRTPPVSVEASLSPSAISSCGDATLTLTVRNTSATAPALALDAEITLPPGLSYRDGTTQIDCGGVPVPAPDDPTPSGPGGQTLTWYDICDVVGPGESAVLRFGVHAACYGTSGAAGIVVRYEGCCGVATRQEVTSSATITALTPSLTLTVTPLLTPLDCGNPLNETTWTITVANAPGAARADFVRIEETLGTALAVVSASDGGVSLGGGRWGWELEPLEPGASKSVLLTVRLLQPANDCSPGRRQGSARATWGCGAFDGDPNTVEGCVGSTVGPATTRITIPDLSLFPSDIAPRFVCTGDQISSGSVALRVRNTGDSSIDLGRDFSVRLSEATTGWQVVGTFVSLGGTLPFYAGTSQVLTIPGWTGSCGACSYTFSATLDGGGAICECRESNNAATRTYAPTAPDVTVASSDLRVSCSTEGSLRLQGPVTLRNAGCGAALTANVAMRFTVYDGPTCGGNILTQWMQTFTGVNIPAGGTQEFIADRTATVNVCGVCQVSVWIEADYTSLICECSGANNTRCTGALPVAFPDLIASAIDFSRVTCSGDSISGQVAVRVMNAGCGPAGAFNVSLATDGCLTFAPIRVSGLVAQGETVASFEVPRAWADCTDCSCVFTATVDSSGEVCECSSATNTLTRTYANPLPDLTITSVTVTPGTPCVAGSAQVTVRNAGCVDVAAGVLVSLSGDATGEVTTTTLLAPGASVLVNVPFAAALGCGPHSLTATVDPTNAVCECPGTNNTRTASFSVIAADLVTSQLAATCRGDDRYTVTGRVENTGQVAASGIAIRLDVDGVPEPSVSADLAPGAAYTFSAVTRPVPCGTTHAFRLVADEGGAICECSEANNEAQTSASCPCPALSVDKETTAVWRGTTNLGSVAVVEPGDVIVYRFTITNVGGGTAFGVDFTDALPAGLVYETAAPGADGAWSVSGGGSGTFVVPDGGTTFTTAIGATVPAGETLTATYSAFVTSNARNGASLTNFAAATGRQGSGDAIAESNPSLGDTTDSDQDDADADDTGSETITPALPGLAVEKAVIDIRRGTGSIGTSGPVEPGDIVTYQVIVRNVGPGTAYHVDFTDQLAAGLVTETDPPGSPGTYEISSPHETGSLSVPDGATPSFTTSIDSTLVGEATLTATYTALVTSGIVQGQPITNVVRVFGEDGAGTPIPEENPDVPDLFPDTAPATIGDAKPGLSVDKVVADVLRGGVSVGTSGPVLFGDVIVYRFTVRNVGLGTAYHVEVQDTLPPGLLYTSASSWGRGIYEVSSPYVAGDLSITDGQASFASAIDATIAGGGVLAATYAARVTNAAPAGVDLTNVASATGRDGAGTEIPDVNQDVGDIGDDDAEDSDADDTGIASIRVGVPALVTDKSVASILRGGGDVGSTGPIEPGDVVAYRLEVRNVGQAPALDVAVVDELPVGFAYVPGTALVTWPGGGSVADPWDVTSPYLDFPLGARLEPGETLVLTFQARVAGPVEVGISYTNILRATGRDLLGNEIPADNHALVPSDGDLDDADRVALLGAAGPAAAPVLRKTAKTAAQAGCVGPGTVADRIWFQTDIALYAAYELDELGALARVDASSATTLLPTWMRTAAELGASVSLDNLLQVAAFSQVGVPLEWGPRVARVARESGRPAKAALDVLLAGYAEEAGLLPAERPRNERWIVIELEGGDPRYATRDREALPSGTWLVYEETIRASALGMGFLAGAREAGQLLGSTSALDRYRGLVVAEAIANKLELLDQRIARPVTEGTLRIVPTACAAVFKDDVLGFEVRDETSLLFDQVSLLFGLSEVLTFLQEAQQGVYAHLAPFGTEYRDLAQKLLLEVLQAVRLLHRNAPGEVAETWSPTAGRGPAPSTLLRGLLAAALERAAPFAGEPALALLREQADRLLSQARATGAVEDDPIGELALIRGLLAAQDALGTGGWLSASERAFDHVVDASWDERIGFFRGWEELPCITPLEVGVAIGALREVALHSDAVRSDRAARVLSRILDGIIQDAGLHLAYALPDGLAPIRGEASETWPLVVADAALGVAPVLQERICIQTPPLCCGCIGWRPVDEEPWYQTDLAMYAAFAIQENLAWAEDIADANLASLDLYSRLGIPLEEGRLVESLARSGNLSRAAATDELRAKLARYAGLTEARLPDPVTIPFYAASPRLPTGETLAWNPGTFDRTVTGSALGTTLLREAQEAFALLSTRASGEVGRTASEAEYALLLLASITDKLLLLDEVSLEIKRSTGVAYVPHALSLSSSPDGLRWEVLDSGSDLFDQLSLLLGLAETYRLLSSPGASEALEAVPNLAAASPALVLDLSAHVLETLAEAHADPVLGSLVNRATLRDERWVREERATTTLLGLVVSALDRAANAFPREQAEKALGLLKIETGFLRQAVAQGLRDHYPVEPDEACPCGGPDLASHLAAIEALVIGATRGLDPGDLACAQGTFDLLEASRWDPSTDLYLPGLDLEARCYTPLDLGLAASALEKLAQASEPLRSQFIRERLRSTFTGLANAARLQLSEVLDETEDEVDRPFAPVLARRVCLALRGAGNGETGQGRDTIRYTVTVDNPTRATWTSLLLEDVLPVGVTYMSADPVAQVDGSKLHWTFDRLLPGESRSYSVLGAIDPGARPAENCAALSYANAAGVPQPPLRACAAALAEAAAPTLGKTGVEVVVPAYATEGAMLLSYVLERVVSQSGPAFAPGDRARAYSRANLEALLGESGLGLPLVSIGTENVAEGLAALAAGVGLEEAPSLPLPIYVPFRGGDPRYIAGEGFVRKDATLRSGAVGATLAREALVLLENRTDPDGLFWRHFVEVTAENGVAWLALSAAATPSGAPRIPALRAPDGEILDLEGRLRDDALLLLGLSEITLADPAQANARDLARIVLDSLAAHRDPSGQWQDGETFTSWADLGWAAVALEKAIEALPNSREVARVLLEDLGRTASGARPLADPIGEAGRIRALLARGTAGASEARAVWEAFRAAFWDEARGVFGFPGTSAAEWVYRSGDVALVFEMMHSLAQAVPDLAGDLLERMAATFERVVERGLLQLALPIEPSACCGIPGGPRYGIAPVFGSETTLLGWPIAGALGEIEPLDVALFRIEVTPSASGTFGSLILSDCPGEGLALVPGSAWMEEGLESRRALPARTRPMSFGVQRLTGPAAVSYLLIAGPDVPAAWQNEACGTWIDPAGRLRLVRTALESK
jgi:uncharacterized repeat protein (TIGR01451 family)